MSKADWIALGAAGVSLLSLGWSVVTSVRQSKADKRHRDLAERVLSFDLAQHKRVIAAETRADVRLTLERNYNNWRFLLVNRGPADAYEVNIHFDIPSGSGIPYHPEAMRELLPIEILQRDAETPLQASMAMGVKFPIEGTLTWQDTSGPQRKRFVLPLPA